MINEFDKPTSPAIPKIVQLGAWLLSFLVFAIGFWHTHLGLKEMRPFGSEWGGLVIAGVVLLLMLITYYFAIQGKKVALLFYIFCGLVFFVCNLNYFYPSYLGRTLLKEEATALNDTLQKYTNRANVLLNKAGFTSKEGDGSLSDYMRMKQLAALIQDEILKANDIGPRTDQYVNELNKLLGPYSIKPINRRTGDSREDRANFYRNGYEAGIKNWLMARLQKGNDVGYAAQLLVGVGKLDTLQLAFTPLLTKQIIPDNSDVNLDSVKTHPQIQSLQMLVSGMDEATSKINESLNQPAFVELKEAPIRNLGKIAHTLSSIQKRSSSLDTIAIVFICLLMDLLVPLAIYSLLKNQPTQHRVDPFKLGRGPILLD